jgi:hypothetical protein
MFIELYEDEHELVLLVCIVDEEGKCYAVLPIKASDNVVAVGTAELLASDPYSWCDWKGTEIPGLFYERGVLDKAHLLAHYDGVWHEDNKTGIKRCSAASAFLSAYYAAIAAIGVTDCEDCRTSGLLED